MHSRLGVDGHRPEGVAEREPRAGPAQRARRREVFALERERVARGGAAVDPAVDVAVRAVLHGGGRVHAEQRAAHAQLQVVGVVLARTRHSGHGGDRRDVAVADATRQPEAILQAARERREHARLFVDLEVEVEAPLLAAAVDAVEVAGGAVEERIAMETRVYGNSPYAPGISKIIEAVHAHALENRHYAISEFIENAWV